MNNYPNVFVHGLNGWGGNEGINGLIPYWGATTGDLIKYLHSEGYECYSASVGPVSSVWDRVCELYAQLTGTTVDYGVLHSRKFNHKRFGREYDAPLVPGFGEKDSSGNIKKINLIGHSFGGTTVRLFAYLLTYGWPEEVEAAGDSASGLFTGGKEYLINSVTTICTPHNSSSIYKFVTKTKLFEILLNISALYCGALGRSPINGKLVDFHLEQFGLSNTPGSKDADKYIEAVRNFLENSDDTCEYDMMPAVTDEFNKRLKICPDIYYFSYSFDSTFKDKITGKRWPIVTSNPVIAPLGIIMTQQKEFTNEITGQVYDEEWRPNDLLCNTISQKYPFTEPHIDYNPYKSPEKGIWNVMPVQQGDHGTAIGLLASKSKTRAMYSNLMAIISGLN
ncbi:MAG: hypothetical protein IJJ61_00885 [Clostridia bacterium]|nr:hypothetical protein [Clostridia bacterium]